MLEVFKFLVFCLVSVIITSLSGSLFYVCALSFVLTIIFYDFDFTIGLERHAIGKVKRFYLKVRKFYTALFEIDQNISRYHSTPKMNSVNKQTSSFDLSRFNKSGNVVSPITNNGNSFALSSKRLIQSRQTSTPLTKTLPWQKNSISPANNMRTPAYQNSIMTRSPRYSLSSVNTTPKSANHESPSTPTIQTVTGPLLASTRFNVNLGTYTDTKSPGLASRVVQYNNELSGNQTSTHQAKYGSPGQFPIVQLYKKELPILARSPRRCTVRIAPPDPISYNSDQANIILRDSFLQNNVDSSGTQADTEINTKSVLEALKEISRKRIHTNDDIDDISKRQRKGSVSTASTSSDHLNKDGKRMREDTPPKPKEPTSPNVNSAPKRICVVNEIESSLSSSRLMRLQQGQKRKASLNATQNLNKQRRVSNGQLVSRQTQTPITNGSTSANSSTSTSELPTDKHTVKRSTAAQTEEQTTEKLSEIQLIMRNSRRKHKPNEEKTIEDIDEMNSTLPFVCPVSNPPKPIFREEPLEIMRHNKLEVLLAAWSDTEPNLIPLPTVTLSGLRKESEANADAVDAGNKEVISILSPKNKVKHDKHVTFAIPNSDETNNKASDDTSKSTENGDKPSDSLPAISFDSNPLSSISTSNSGATATPNKSSALPFASTNSSLSFSAPISFGSSANSTVSSPSVPLSLATSAAFGISAAVTSTAASTNNLTFGSPTSSVKPSEQQKINSPSFSATTTTTVSNNVIPSSTVQNADKSVNPAINFGVGQSGLNFGSSAFGSGSSLNPPTFGGLVPSSTAASSTADKSDSNPTLSSSTPATTASVGFQLPSTKSSTPSTGANLFGTTVASTAASTLPFSAPSLPLGTPSSQPTITFGGTKPPAFPTNSNSIVTTSVTPTVNFGMPSNQASSMFPATTAVSFGTTTSSAVTTTASGMFGMKPKPETTSATTAASSFSFGSTTTSGQTQNKSGGFKFDLSKPATNLNVTQSKTEPAKPMFGGDTNLNKSAAFTFGSSSTTTTTSTPTFGTTSSSKSTGGFGTPTATASAGVFGGSTKTSTVGGFGTPNKTVGTGAFGTAGTNTSAFATPSTTTNTGGFGTSSTPANTGTFGTSSSTNSGLFGTASSAAPTFGASKPAESAPGFGTFGPSNSTQNTGFGNFSTPTTTQASSTFGFGATPTTQSNNTFGSTPANTTSTFTFGTNTASKPFAFSGSATVTTTAASSMFGSTTPATNSTNLFGNSTNSAFGTPTGTSNAFGTPTTTTTASTFGQPSTGAVFGTASSGFGTGTSGPVFGGTSNPNNNTFSTPNAFGTPAQQSGTFGTGPSNQANVFGSSNANQGSTFGAANANQSGTFGTTSNAPAFGGGFGGAANTQQTSGFGTFGSPATQAPIQQSGVFAFGGSSAPAPAAAAPAAGPSSNAFQFGGAASTPAKSSGFNFSANANTPNMNFAASTTPAFGASAAPAFGSPAASGQFSAQAPSAGMFSIGSGSTAPKQRPMIKARRRT